MLFLIRYPEAQTGMSAAGMDLINSIYPSSEGPPGILDLKPKVVDWLSLLSTTEAELQ